MHSGPRARGPRASPEAGKSFRAEGRSRLGDRNLCRFRVCGSAVGGRRSAVGGRRSAVGGRRSAVGGRRSAVGGDRLGILCSSQAFPPRSGHLAAHLSSAVDRPEMQAIGRQMPGCRVPGAGCRVPGEHSEWPSSVNAYVATASLSALVCANQLNWRYQPPWWLGCCVGFEEGFAPGGVWFVQTSSGMSAMRRFAR